MKLSRQGLIVRVREEREQCQAVRAGLLKEYAASLREWKKGVRARFSKIVAGLDIPGTIRATQTQSYSMDVLRFDKLLPPRPPDEVFGLLRKISHLGRVLNWLNLGTADTVSSRDKDVASLLEILDD